MKRAAPTVAEIDAAMLFLADVRELYGDWVLPIYQRLERERERLVGQDAARERARALRQGRLQTDPQIDPQPLAAPTGPPRQLP